MNKFLASATATINVFVAWALILGSPILGMSFAGAEGFIVGLFAGLILAVLVCGILALLIDMRNCLREIAAAARREAVRGKQS